jgi:hypothetical protein
MKSKLTFMMYGAVEENDFIVHVFEGKKMVQQLIVEFMQYLKPLMAESRDTRNLKLIFDKQPLSMYSPKYDPFDGLDAKTKAELIAIAVPATDEEIAEAEAEFAKMNDPLYRTYTMLTQTTAAEQTPESLAQMRVHMECNYPDYPRKW